MRGNNGKPLTASSPVRRARPWVDKLARFGHIVKGALYLIVGLLAVSAAVGVGGRTTDPRGALHSVFSLPGGTFLLGATAAGLFGFAISRFFQAALNLDRHPRNAKGAVMRIGYAL